MAEGGAERQLAIHSRAPGFCDGDRLPQRSAAGAIFAYTIQRERDDATLPKIWTPRDEA
jgi:hypothetical protein